MNRAFHATAAVVLATAGTAFAQGTQSIEVRGQWPVRTDATTVCPGIADELPDVLAAVARRVSEPALLEVSFQIDGTRIDTVTAQGGPRAYGRAVRQAVRGLACDNGSAGRQTVLLRVRFADPSAAARHDGAVALVETAPAQR